MNGLKQDLKARLIGETDDRTYGSVNLVTLFDDRHFLTLVFHDHQFRNSQDLKQISQLELGCYVSYSTRFERIGVLNPASNHSFKSSRYFPSTKVNGSLTPFANPPIQTLLILTFFIRKYLVQYLTSSFNIYHSY